VRLRTSTIRPEIAFRVRHSLELLLAQLVTPQVFLGQIAAAETASNFGLLLLDDFLVLGAPTGLPAARLVTLGNLKARGGHVKGVAGEHRSGTLVSFLTAPSLVVDGVLASICSMSRGWRESV
jgi:hypothetical protein